MSFEELRDEMKKEAEERGYEDSGDANDVRSDAFWDRINSEFWEEASKDIDYLLELYEDIDHERAEIQREKKLLDDMYPGGGEWLEEVTKRRLYYRDKNKDAANEEELDDEEIAALYRDLKEKVAKGEDPFPNTPETRTAPDETVTGIVNEEDEDADIRYGY